MVTDVLVCVSRFLCKIEPSAAKPHKLCKSFAAAVSKMIPRSLNATATRNCNFEWAHQVARYQGKLSGPFLDRLDLLIEVPLIPPRELQDLAEGESSADVAQRVAAAQARARQRQGKPNAQLAAQDLTLKAPLQAAAKSLLERSAERLGWSARSFHRVQRVARTIADLAGSEAIAAAHVAEAIQLRRGLPQAA